jgi:hypothetical protein
MGCAKKSPQHPTEVLNLQVLAMGALDTPRGERLDWLKERLAVDDEVRVRIVEVEEVSPPGSRRPIPHELSVERRKEHTRRMAAEFGWKIIEE